jgi:hypothetical protein
MSLASLKKNKKFEAAIDQLKKKDYLLALDFFRATLASLDVNAVADRAYVRIQLAKCYSHLGAAAICSDLNGSHFEEFDRFIANLNAAEQLLNSLPKKDSWSVKVQKHLADIKPFFSNTLDDRISSHITAPLARKIESVVEGDFNQEIFNARLKRISLFFPRYDRVFTHSHYHHFANTLAEIAQAYLNSAEEAGVSLDHSIQFHVQAIACFKQATDLISEYALVKQAKIHFDLWRAYEGYAIRTPNPARKIAAYKAILKAFDTIFDIGEEHYARRVSQHVCALVYVRNACLELAKLTNDESEKANYNNKVAEFTQALLDMSARFNPEEVALQHQFKVTATLNELMRETTSKKIAELNKRALAPKRAFEPKPKSNAHMSTTDSGSDTSSDEDSSDDELLLPPRKKAKPAPQAPASAASSLGLSSTNSSAALFSSSAAQPAGSKPPFFNKQPIDRYYNHNQILLGLDQRLRAEIDRKEVMVFGGLKIADAFEQIQPRINALRVEAQNGGIAVATKFAIPVHINGNHWAALFLNFQHGLNAAPAVTYVDPLNTDVPVAVRNKIRDCLGVNVIQSSPHQYQNDGDNCGPWVIAILASLAKTGGLPARQLNIEQIRVEDAANVVPQQGFRHG